MDSLTDPLIEPFNSFLFSYNELEFDESLNKYELEFTLSEEIFSLSNSSDSRELEFSQVINLSNF
jgi:hypothetical protein